LPWRDLLEAVDRLTLTTKQVAKADGRLVFYDAPPLLEELAEAVHPSGERGGGGAGVSPGSPASLEALDLLVEIEDAVTEAYWAVRSLVSRPGYEGSSLAGRLRWVAERVDEGNHPYLVGPGIVRTPCLELLADVPSWVVRIQRLFNPPRVVPLAGHACPMCWQDRTTVQTEPGVFMSTCALTILLGRHPMARCGECGASWAEGYLLDLAAALGLEVQAMAGLLATLERSKT